MRGAILLLWVAMVAIPDGAVSASAGCDAGIDAASYDGPTKRYPHGALGDDIEWTILQVQLQAGTSCNMPPSALTRTLPETLVFEDVAPRLADLDGDGKPEIIVVESHRQKGARLAVWGMSKDGLAPITATPFIGTRFRWLAPLGAADLDGDGKSEIAYIDRPHLAAILRVWRYDNGQLKEVAAVSGLSNHRFAEREIAGGIRDCGDGPEMITATADWTSIVATTLRNGKLTSKRIAPFAGRGGLDRAMACQ